MNYSFTLTGLIIAAVATLAQNVGVNVTESDLTTTIATIGQLAGAVLIYWGRFRQGDINWLGKKK